MPEQHAQLLQLALAQQRQGREVYSVFGEDLGVTIETELSKPGRQLVHHVPLT
jgi:hypothetical protein